MRECSLPSRYFINVSRSRKIKKKYTGSETPIIHTGSFAHLFVAKQWRKATTLVHFAKCVYMNSLHTDHDQVQRALTQTHAQLKHWMWSLTAHICTRTHWPCMNVYNIHSIHKHVHTDHAWLSTTSASHPHQTSGTTTPIYTLTMHDCLQHLYHIAGTATPIYTLTMHDCLQHPYHIAGTASPTCCTWHGGLTC